MGGCRCSYRTCKNTTKTRENLHFFHYPVKQKERCRQWIENAEKTQFYNLDEDQLRNKVVCETHFEINNFSNIQKKRLLHGAIPTLDGDCEFFKIPATERTLKLNDVNILPTNEEGTIFVLETNLQSEFESEKIESYIYTNNGLVLPINKFDINEGSEVDANASAVTARVDSEKSNQNQQKTMESFFFTENVNESIIVVPDHTNVVEEQPVTINAKRKLDQESHESKNDKKLKTVQVEESIEVKELDDELFLKSIGSKYVRQIKQHSKDIAILKRMLKGKNLNKKPHTSYILSHLKRHLPMSLFSIVNFNLNSSTELNSVDLELFATIYSKSPDLYQILSEKYKWNMPTPEFLTNSYSKNNGYL